MSLKPDGSINWVKDIPADSLALAPNGDIVIISAHGLPLVARLDSQGNLKWAIEFHGNPLLELWELELITLKHSQLHQMEISLPLLFSESLFQI